MRDAERQYAALSLYPTSSVSFFPPFTYPFRFSFLSGNSADTTGTLRPKSDSVVCQHCFFRSACNFYGFCFVKIPKFSLTQRDSLFFCVKVLSLRGAPLDVGILKDAASPLPYRLVGPQSTNRLRPTSVCPPKNICLNGFLLIRRVLFASAEDSCPPRFSSGIQLPIAARPNH